MNHSPSSMGARAPHEVLGLAASATVEEVRSRYLELVKEFPPERDPDRFHEIHQAYLGCCDPLTQAKRIINTRPEPRRWEEIMAEADQRAPRLGVETLLSLGNQKRK